MTRDADAKNARLFDRRTVERNIKKGLVTRKDYEKHLKALADIADKGTHGSDEPDDEPDEPDEPEAGDAGTNSHN
ncbi:MAG TPA: hypothetical protein VGL59_19145 [Polyangia bacterium]|jgi:hypothetical protein